MRIDIKKHTHMTERLNLTIDPDIKKKAVSFAKKQNKSISKIVEDYLSELTKSKKKGKIEIPPEVKAVTGSLKAPKNKHMDWRKAKVDYLTKKHGI